MISHLPHDNCWVIHLSEANKMTDQDNANLNAVYVAIDVAKNKHDILIRYTNGKQHSFKIYNTMAGYQKLIDAAKKYSNEMIICGFEPTADYHRNLAYWLSTLGCEMRLISSLSCARAREMLYKTWDKNDRKDTHVIMYLLENQHSQPFYDPLLENIMDTQEICNTYQQVSLARSRCWHSLLNHYLTLYFPEIERFLHNSRSEWFCRFLLKFPTPNSITRYRQDTFIKRAWDVVGRKVSKQGFLENLYELAGNSIALPVEINSPAVETFKLQIARYMDLTKHRSQLEAQADQLLSSRKDYQLLRSLPGIGPVIATIILAESGDLMRFKHYRQYLNFCGFNLCSKQSGKHVGKYCLSKRGNARLRYAYWLAANSAIRSTENSFRNKYTRYIKQDPENADLKRKARTAVAIKMARVAHAIVKKGQHYQGYYEYRCET